MELKSSPQPYLVPFLKVNAVKTHLDITSNFNKVIWVYMSVLTSFLTSF